MQTLQRYRPYIITSLVWFIILGIYVMYDRWPRPEVIVIETPVPSAAPTLGNIVVHITGAVVRPGVYQLAPGARVEQAVRAAGGFLPEADNSAINLAAPLSDGQMLRILKTGETPPPNLLSERSETNPSIESGLLNINQATAEQLEALPGIGPTLAGRIIAYRDTYGPFHSLEEVDLVEGIGQACINKIRDLIIFE